MKNKILIAGTALVISVLAISVFAVGPKGSENTTGTQGVQIQQQTQTQQQTKTSNQGEERQLRVETRERVQNQEQVQKTGQINAQEHRSRVANFVQSLLNIAEREKGIGDQVRIIARQQNESATKTIQAMEKIQTRSKIKTILIGSDYKNLGTLRSELVQTRNRLEQLKRLMERVENEGDRIELQNQIQVLEQEQARIENFVRAQEGKISLFGWLVKLLSGYKSTP